MAKVKPGDVFSRLTVMERVGISKNGTIRWRCSCNCGGESIVDSAQLNRGNVKSCGCLAKESARAMMKILHEAKPAKQPDIGGLYGRWLVVKCLDEKDNEGSVLYECECQCDNKTVRAVSAHKLTRAGKKSNSCGCLRLEMSTKANTTHGLSNTSFYRAIKASERRAIQEQATVLWDEELTELVVQEAYEKANMLRDITGLCFDVDHIVPLKAGTKTMQLACGLHVWNNLRPMPASKNRKKNNLHWPDMWEYSKKDLKELKAIAKEYGCELRQSNLVALQ